MGRTGWVGRFQRPSCRPCLHAPAGLQRGFAACDSALGRPPSAPFLPGCAGWVSRFQRLPCRPCLRALTGYSAAPPLVAAPSLRAGKGVSGSPGVRLCRPPVSPPRTGPRTSASGVTRPCPPIGRGRGFAPYALDRPTRLRLASGRFKAWAPHQGCRPGPGAAPPNSARGRPTRLRLANGRPLARRLPAPVAVLAWPGLLRPRAVIRAHATCCMRMQPSVCAYNMQHAACCMRLDCPPAGGWSSGSHPCLGGNQ